MASTVQAGTKSEVLDTSIHISADGAQIFGSLCRISWGSSSALFDRGRLAPEPHARSRCIGFNPTSYAFRHRTIDRAAASRFSARPNRQLNLDSHPGRIRKGPSEGSTWGSET